MFTFILVSTDCISSSSQHIVYTIGICKRIYYFNTNTTTEVCEVLFSFKILNTATYSVEFIQSTLLLPATNLYQVQSYLSIRDTFSHNILIIFYKVS